MDNNNSPMRLHPLMTAAAVSVIVLSGVGIAALTGVLPHFGKQDTAATAPATSAPADANTTAAPGDNTDKANGEKTASASRERDEPAHKTHVRHVADAEPAYGSAPKAASCPDCGTVISITPVAVAGKASGIGAVGGAILGGVVGHQFGGGHGKDAMTAVGAIGGALAGNEVEKSQRQTTRYDVGVRLENGSERTFSFNTQPDVQVGDHIKVENGTLIHN